MADSQNRIQYLQVEQSGIIDDYNIQRNSAINNLSEIVEGTRKSIEIDIKILEYLSSEDGVNWVLSRVKSNDESAIVLRSIASQGGFRIDSVQDAANFRVYASGVMQQRIAAKVETLSNRLNYPNELAADFLEDAKTTESSMKELQKRVVIEGGNDAKQIIEELDEWEKVNSELDSTNNNSQRRRNAKSQIVNEITDRRVNQATSIAELVENQQNLRKTLESHSKQDTTFEIKGKARTKSQIVNEFENYNQKAQNLRKVSEVNPSIAQSSETIAREEAKKDFRIRRSAILARIEEYKTKLAKVEEKIRKRQNPRTGGRRQLPEDKLLTEKTYILSEIQKLLDEYDSLNRHRRFNRKINIRQLAMFARRRKRY